MNKTVEQWLRELPEPFREQALANWREDEALEENVSSMPDAIDAAFYWRNTPEGGNYWQNLCDHYIAMEMDQNLRRDGQPLSS